MRKFKRLTMTLALLITAVTGAWAQSSLNVVEFEVPAEWQEDESYATAGDLPGFKASTFDEAKAWTGAPKTGNAILFYAFDGEGKAYYVSFVNGTAEQEAQQTLIMKAVVFGQKSDFKFYYTVEPTEWSLTPDETGKKWTIDKMPASNIELQVEYFAESNLFLSKDALADKDNIVVKNGETTVEFGDDGKSANTVTEGSAMTVTYNGTKKLLGMKVAKKAEAKTLAEATSEDIGKIAGKDGKIYATKADAEAVATGNAVAMIAYVGTASDCAHGLAIALADESGTKNYEAAGTACSGKAAVTGGTWRLPSIKDWQYMLIGCGASESYKDNPSTMSYSGLASMLTTAQGNALVQGVSYWSSTGYTADNAWRLYINGSIVNFTLEYKGNNRQVRACLAF